MKHLCTIAIIIIVLISSCQKESFTTASDARISFSADTLHFDTVFTSVGSVTQLFIIYNDNNRKLRLSDVSLSGGATSPFKMNVDGIAGGQVSNVEIEANDSVYVFVSVKIDPTATALPFVISDSIRIEYNGNVRWVQLDAWGQNANFLRSKIIATDEVWTNTKPYVILGGLQVDTGATLTIEKGCRIYLHADAPFIVDGTLLVNGDKEQENRVIFQGDRLDEPYRDFPAGWPGIFFRGESKDNVLTFAIIKNAYQGIVSDKPAVNVNSKVVLDECIVDNCYDAGILALQSDIAARNCLISNCGKNIVLAYGGHYNFIHCTSVAYSNAYLTHKDPVLLITDFIKVGNDILTNDLSAILTNCIFWGDNGTVEDEVVTAKAGSGSFIVNFENCLWKLTNQPADVTATNMILNEDPLFDTVSVQDRQFNFHLKAESPAINKGLATSIVTDLDGNPRTVVIPDLGCYEK